MGSGWNTNRDACSTRSAFIALAEQVEKDVRMLDNVGERKYKIQYEREHGFEAASDTKFAAIKLADDILEPTGVDTFVKFEIQKDQTILTEQSKEKIPKHPTNVDMEIKFIVHVVWDIASERCQVRVQDSDFTIDEISKKALKDIVPTFNTDY